MHALILGAGFSQWAVGLPTVSSLLDFQVEPFGPRDIMHLESVRKLKADWDASHNAGYHPEEFISYALSLGGRAKDSTLWYLSRRLSEPFIWKEFHAFRWRRHVLMIDEHRKLDVPGMNVVQSFLQGFIGMACAGIITTNYDLVIEYGLGTSNFNYGKPGQSLVGRGPYPVSTWLHPVSLKGHLPLATLHGSISWDDHGLYSDGRRGITGNALIIAPTRQKSIPPALQPAWDLAATILKQSSSVVVFGFSFNPLDDDVLNLLRTAGRGIESVLLIDVAANALRLRAEAIWPHASISVAPPPPDGNEALAQWKAEQLH